MIASRVKKLTASCISSSSDTFGSRFKLSSGNYEFYYSFKLLKEEKSCLYSAMREVSLLLGSRSPPS